MTRTLSTELFSGIIDYAGLFPPAKLPMATAVEEYARELRSDCSWMLSRFILPVARLDEFAEAARDLWQDGEPWRLSILSADPETDRPTIDGFNREFSGRASIDAAEHRPETPEAVASASHAFEGLEVYFELPYQEDLAPWLAAVAAGGGHAKIRTGGVTTDAFPSSTDLARFLLATHRAGVPFKATAGLHHPLRGEYPLTYEADSELGTMHGFLNLFLAAAWVTSGQLDTEEDIVALLEERSPAEIRATGNGWAWRSLELTPQDAEASRKRFARSYGSCSFAEPVADLQGLGWL